MICTKDQLVKGIQEFLNEDIVPGIQDKPLKMALYAITQFPGMIQEVIEKPTARIVLQESDGQYDLDQMHSAFAAALDKFGSFPITINPIPFIIPSQVQINLNRADLDSLIRHVERVVTYG